MWINCVGCREAIPEVKQLRLTVDIACCLRSHKMKVTFVMEGQALQKRENCVLMKIVGREREDMTGEWRKFRNVKLRDLCSSLSIYRVIKWRRMRRVELVASNNIEKYIKYMRIIFSICRRMMNDNIKMKLLCVRMWTGCIWPIIESWGRFFLTRELNLFMRKEGNCNLAERILVL